jgi:arsenate reductase
MLRRLGAEPWDIARLGEPVASELGLADQPRNRAAWIAILAAHPILIQRPILLLDDGTAVIGRSAEALQAALDVCPLPPSR